MIFFDLETTGTDPETDRIVELAALFDDDRGSYHRRFNPGVPIPAGASAVHGITDDDVADEPPFREEAPRLQAMFEDEVLCGYNIRSFDTPLLHTELRRAGQPGFDLDEVPEVDLMRVWEELEGDAEGRGWKLADAVERFLETTLEDAHSAMGDAAVLRGLMEAIRDEHRLSLEEMLILSRRPDEVDRAGKLRRRNGRVVLAFGRYRGEPAAEHLDYLEWILKADFPEDTKRAVRRVMEEVTGD